MKILLLSDTYSEHTEKWALGLANKGIKIGLFSFNKSSYEWHTHPNITVFFEPAQKINAESTLTKLSYIKHVNILKKIIKHFEPDILHAHYATSYGLVGALTNFHPFAVSVWGSDVYDFPKRSRLHKRVLQYNLRHADLLLSTSEIMKVEIAKYVKHEVVVTPFGVDINNFAPFDIEGKDKSIVHIGTIKPIEEKYGIRYIIDAAEMLIEKRPDQKFRFYLIGRSYDLDFYIKMIADKGLTDYFEVPGRIPFSEVNHYHNLLDIFLNVSVNDSESFGVATVEAMACEKPVIVTDVGGLMEVVDHGKYGSIVPKENAAAICDAVLNILDHPKQFEEQAKLARAHVKETYEWGNNLDIMISEYEKILEKNKRK